MTASKIYFDTKALCSTCREIVKASVVEIDRKIYLKKFCGKHGEELALFCSDSEWFSKSMAYVKPGQRPVDHSVKIFQGCPDSCGLCSEHQQHTCLPIIEVTSDCDLNCPICLKKFNESFNMTPDEFKSAIKRLKECEENVQVINLSGGEPTLNPNFKRFIEIAGNENIMQTTVSTNGLTLLKNKELRKLFRDTGTIAALQFDGFLPETYKVLRGKDLSKEKLELLNILEKEGIRFSFVATIMKNVNDKEISAITNFFFESKAISLMFQPMVFTGTAGSMDSYDDRITIPDIVKEIESSVYVKIGDFNPLPCSHYTCFALSYYFQLEDKKFLSLKEFLGIEDYLNLIANKTLPGLDQEGYECIKNKIYQLWSASDSSDLPDNVLKRIRKILDELNTRGINAKARFNIGAQTMKGIFIHQFMDKQTFDFARIVKCCNHYAKKNGLLIPMCVENVFFQS